MIRTVLEYKRDHCTPRAGSLAYSTLMAVVPLSAFVVALLTAFGSFSNIITEIQVFLVQILVPTKQDEFGILIEEFIGNSQALGIVGFLLFAVTSINLINNITLNMNAIWGTEPKGNILGKFTSYTSTLLFGTLLIGVSFTGRALLTSIMSPEVSTLWSFIVVSIPTLFMYVAFLLLISLVPGTKVELRYAAIGSLFGVIFWELAKKGFVEGSNFVLRASVMYGSLALIPIFLFWLYIIWMIILVSAELTYCLQYSEKPWSVYSFERMEPAQRFSLGIQIFLLISRAFRNGDPPPSKNFIADQMGIALDDVNAFISILEQNNLVRSIGRAEWTLVPARPLETITFREIMACLMGSNPAVRNTSSYFQKMWGEMVSETESLLKINIDDYLINEIIEDV